MPVSRDGRTGSVKTGRFMSRCRISRGIAVQLLLAGADVAGSWRRGPLATATARNVGSVIGSYLVHGGMAELPRHSTKLRHHRVGGCGFMSMTDLPEWLPGKWG